MSTPAETEKFDIVVWHFKAFIILSYGILAVTAAAVAGLLIWLKLTPNDPPSDQSMIDTFQAHRAVFEELREKICALPESQTVMMDPAWSRPQVTGEVRDEYYRLLKIINATGIQGVKTKPDAECSGSISYWAKGWAGDGDYKEYSFNFPIGKDDMIVGSLDDLPLHPTEIQFFRRELTDGWAMEYRHWP